ncbi:hypothetical protein [Fluviicola sp.]|uniref:hypothetical protein n=1 Tax=Fluviicola sp. TaxID=1917219 RepID=UPI002627680D|nr:hypothetical protein [Fluviicola sp.]
MKKIIFLFAIISIGLSSCKKEQITPEPSKKTVQTSDTKGLHCAPWRDAADADAAAIDLNAVGICNTSLCSGGTTTYSYSNNMIVRDGSGAIVYFLAFTPVTIADQNAIWSNAVSQAITNTPVGFSLSSIHNFRTEVASGPFLVYRMRFDITYIKCTGGGGGGES